MTPERYQQIGQLFDEVMERAPEERDAFLKQAGGEDVELRGAVEKLLDNLVTSEQFLSRPALNVAAELYAKNQPAENSSIGKQISHYEILSLLGAGGMGQVYLAKDKRLGRAVALKLLPARFMQNAEHLRRFEREALAASALNHPNILTIYEFGSSSTEAGETHFLATELVQGKTLRQRLTRGQLTIIEVLDVTAQIAAALQAAHEAGIIHRDIKPENVMIRRDGLVKVLDFGLAKLAELRKADFGRRIEEDAATLIPDSHLTLPGAILGTVAYMSPEQARGQAVDARTDLFSLGVVLYELLAGRRPFTGETVNHTIVAILEQEPPPLSPEVPAELARVVKRLLAKKVEARYPSATALLTDLKRLAKRLDSEAEQPFAVIAEHYAQAPTQIIQRNTNDQFADVTLPLPPDDSALHAVTPTPARGLVRRKIRWWLGALLAAVLIGIPTGRWLLSRSVNPLINATASLPERKLSYSLTVQKYRDGKPYQAEFQSSGREIFEPGWQFKLNVTGAQEGFLYLLNEAPNGNQVLLFPLPLRNNGSAHLTANERFQTGAYLFDEQAGTEQFRLVWAAQPVPELEAVRQVVNPVNKGRISDPAQIQAIQNFLHQASPPLESVRDPQNKQTTISGRGAVLVALIELEHR